MDKRWWEKLLRLLSKVTYMRKWKKAIAVGAACVVFMTTYMLVLPAITITTTGGETSASSVSGTAAEPGMEGAEAAPAIMTAADGGKEESETVSVPGRNDMLYGAVVKTEKVSDTITATIREADGVYTLIFEGTGQIPENTKKIDSIKPFFLVDYGDVQKPLQNLIIREGITSIGEDMVGYSGNQYTSAYTFSYISARHIVLPSTLKKIGAYAFYNAKNLEEIILPSGLEILEGAAFKSCTNLKTMTLNESLRTVESAAFEKTAIETLHLPKGFSPGTSFDKPPQDAYRFGDFPSSIFWGMSKLRTITVDEENETLKAIDNVLYSKDGSVLFFVPPLKADYTIPQHVQKIDGGAFYGHPMLELEIPETVTALGFSFLQGSNIQKLTVPETVTQVFYNTFSSGSVKELTIPKIYSGYGYTTSNQNEDNKTNWTIVMPDSLTKLTFTALGQKVPADFYSARRENRRAGLRTVQITQNVNNPVTYLERDAFSGLKNLTDDILAQLPDVVSVYTEAFLGDASVETLTLPEKLRTIDDRAFGGMASLKEINVYAKNMTAVKDTIFNNASSSAVVKIKDPVEAIPKNFMIALANAGIHTFLFEPNSKTTLPDLTDIKDFSLQLRAGEYYADTYGALYLLEENSAKLACVPKTVSSYTIPAQIDGKM